MQMQARGFAMAEGKASAHTVTTPSAIANGPDWNRQRPESSNDWLRGVGCLRLLSIPSSTHPLPDLLILHEIAHPMMLLATYLLRVATGL